MNLLAVTDIDVAHRLVLVRTDFDLPIDGEGHVLDDWRIRISLPTIEYLTRCGAKVVIMAHLGRPGGVRRNDLSMKPVASRLAQILQRQVVMVSDCIGAEAKTAVGGLTSGQIAVLENLRFHAEEEANERAFAGRLAELGDEYVNEAFGASVRAHASTVGITGHFARPAAGLHLMNELSMVQRFMLAGGRPYVLILGGDKVESKLKVIPELLDRIDVLLVGGLVAKAFNEAMREGNDRLPADEAMSPAAAILERARLSGVKIVLPTDVVVRRISPCHEQRIEQSKHVSDGWELADIGPETRAIFGGYIARAKRVAWNGPMGIYESAGFNHGTMSVAFNVSSAATAGVPTLVGGGNTVAAVKSQKLALTMGSMSVGGGAMLASLAGQRLPGVAALTRTA